MEHICTDVEDIDSLNINFQSNFVEIQAVFTSEKLKMSLCKLEARAPQSLFNGSAWKHKLGSLLPGKHLLPVKLQ